MELIFVAYFIFLCIFRFEVKNQRSPVVMRNKLITAILIFFVCCSTMLAQQTKKEFQDLKTIGLKALDEHDYPLAAKKLTEAELIAERNNWLDELWLINNNLGRVYEGVSNYGEALGSYNRALDIIGKKASLKKSEIAVLNNVGSLYSTKGDDKKALFYYNKAYQAARKYYSGYELFMQKILSANIASIYNDAGKLEEARRILEETRDLQVDSYAMQAWEIIYSKNLYLRGNIKEAMKRAEALFEETGDQTKGTCHKCTLELLSEIYASQYQYDKAIAYTRKILSYNSDLQTKTDTYNRLSELYYKKGDIRKSLLYKDSLISAKDSLTEQMNVQLFQVNEIKYDIEQYKSRLKVSQEKRKGERKIFIGGIFFALILLFALYVSFRNQIMKQKQSRLNAENQKKIVELELIKEKNEYMLLKEKLAVVEHKSKLEQERLRNKIDKKNRMLSANALYQSGRNELLEKIIASLTDMSTVSNNEFIKNYISELKGHLKTDIKWQDFVDHFEKVNPGFLKKIKEEHPQLTQKDIRFLCYLYMNLSTKEICAIFNITPTAFWKRQQRLCEKMDLKKGQLYDYILNLV